MTVKRSLSIISFSTFFFWLIFLIFFFFVDPQEGGIFALIIFFLSLFFGLLGILTLLFIILKFRALKDPEKIFEKFSVSFRQAVFVSLFVISVILFHFFKILEWWSLLAIFLFFLLLELIFSTRRGLRQT
ncbi:MAG: hypothetical protein ACK413_00800 [Patescibacteria group bacterium]